MKPGPTTCVWLCREAEPLSPTNPQQSFRAPLQTTGSLTAARISYRNEFGGHHLTISMAMIYNQNFQCHYNE